MAKICLINFHIYILIDPTSKALMGGAELELFTLATQLKNKHSISIITADWGQKAIEYYQDIPVYRSAQLGGRNYPLNAFRLWQSLKQQKADVYISSGAGPEVAIIALFCRWYHKKYIYRQVSSIDVNGAYIRDTWLFGWLYRWGLEHADRVAICVAEHKQLLLANHSRIDSRNVIYIPLAIKQNKINQTTKRIILWVSRCVPMKNPEIFLGLAKAFPKELFVMIAPRQTQKSAYFEKIAKQANRLANFEFHDFIPFSKIQSYFERAKVFVNTSDYEGFTFTLLQSGAAQTPVLYYAVDPDGVITHHKLGGFASADKNQLHQLLKKLLTNKGYWQDCSKSISRYVNREHSLVKVNRFWLKLITAVTQ